MRLIHAAEMNRSLAETGRIALRNIHFEFGRAENRRVELVLR